MTRFGQTLRQIISEELGLSFRGSAILADIAENKMRGYLNQGRMPRVDTLARFVVTHNLTDEQVGRLVRAADDWCSDG